MSRKSPANVHPRYETLTLDGELTAEQKDKARPDWSRKCENCRQSPVVPMTGMCGPCTFGEADTAAGGWWDDVKDEPTRKGEGAS